MSRGANGSVPAPPWNPCPAGTSRRPRRRPSSPHPCPCPCNSWRPAPSTSRARNRTSTSQRSRSCIPVWRPPTGRSSRQSRSSAPRGIALRGRPLPRRRFPRPTRPPPPPARGWPLPLRSVSVLLLRPCLPDSLGCSCCHLHRSGLKSRHPWCPAVPPRSARCRSHRLRSALCAQTRRSVSGPGRRNGRPTRTGRRPVCLPGRGRR